MPYTRNDGVSVQHGNLSAVNVAAGKGVTIVDRHVSNTSSVSNRYTDADVLAAGAEALKDASTKRSLLEWAGSERATLAVVFTDIVDSTGIGQQLGDVEWREVRSAHFLQSRRFIETYRGHEIKTIGDSFLVVFKTVGAALDYALDLYEATGHAMVRIRAGIHTGALDVEDEDIFGGEVNYAARVIGTVQGAEIRLSDVAKRDIDQVKARSHRGLTWLRHDGIRLKGFEGTSTLWSIQTE